MFSELKPLTALDPLLLYGFVYICPRKELPQLFSHLLPFLSMVFSAKLLKVYTRSCFYVTMDNHSLGIIVNGVIQVQEAIKCLNSIADSMRSHIETRSVNVEVL